jgi:hypothetical protein
VQLTQKKLILLVESLKSILLDPTGQVSRQSICEVLTISPVIG